MKSKKENPSDYPNITYWAFPKIEPEAEFEFYRPQKGGQIFNPETGRWKSAKGIEIIIKVTYLSEPIKGGYGIDWNGYLWRAEIYGGKPLAETGIELRKIEALGSEAFAIAAGLVGALQAFTDSAWYSTGS